MSSKLTPWGTDLDQFLTYERIVAITLITVCAVLFFLQSLTLYRSIKNKLPLIATISGMLMASQIFLICNTIGWYHMNQLRFVANYGTVKLYKTWAWILICNSLFFITFNLSHWIFAQQYYSVALGLETFQLKRDQKKVRLRILSLNVAYGVFLAVILVLTSLEYRQWNNQTLRRSNFGFKFSLQCAAFVLLLAALVKIYYCMRDQAKMIINVREMIVHATAFALYLISDLLLTYTNVSKNGSNQQFLIINLLWVCTLMSSQLLLLLIFNSLCVQKEQAVFDTKLYESLYTKNVKQRDFRVNPSREDVRLISTQEQHDFERSFSNGSL